MTRDASGRVIPLSERFNPDSDSMLNAAEPAESPDPVIAGSKHLSVDQASAISALLRATGLRPAVIRIDPKPGDGFADAHNMTGEINLRGHAINDRARTSSFARLQRQWEETRPTGFDDVPANIGTSFANVVAHELGHYLQHLIATGRVNPHPWPAWWKDPEVRAAAARLSGHTYTAAKKLDAMPWWPSGHDAQAEVFADMFEAYVMGKPVPESMAQLFRSYGVAPIGSEPLNAAPPAIDIETEPAPDDEPADPNGAQARTPRKMSEEERQRRNLTRWKNLMRKSLDGFQDSMDRHGASDDDTFFADYRRASEEKDGERTMGQANAAFANPARSREARIGVDMTLEAARAKLDPELVSDWDAEAKRRIRDYPDGNIHKLATEMVRQVLDGEALDAIQTRMAKYMMDDVWNLAYESGDLDKIKVARRFAWMFMDTGRISARAMAARVDDTKTPAQRNAQFLVTFASGLPKKVEERIRKLPRAEREAALDKAQEEAFAELEAQLSFHGLSIKDILRHEAAQALRESEWLDAIISGIARGNQAEIAALEGIRDGLSDAEITKLTGVGAARIAQLDKLYSEALDKALAILVRQGLGWEKFTGGGLSAPVPAGSEGPTEGPRATGQQLKWAEQKAWTIEQKRLMEAMKDAARVQDGIRNSKIAKRVKNGRGTYRFDLKDTEQVVNLARIIQAARADGLDFEHEFFISMILSGLGTHYVNIAGNTASILFEHTVQRTLERTINMVVQDPDAPQWGEVKYMFRGMGEAFRLAHRRAWAAQRIEHSLFEDEVLNSPIQMERMIERGGGSVAMSEQLVIQLVSMVQNKFGKGSPWRKMAEARVAALRNGATEAEATAAGRKAIEATVAYKFQQWIDRASGGLFKGSVLRIPLRALLYMDEFFKRLSFHVESGAHAYRAARKAIISTAMAEGLRGNALRERVNELSGELINHEVHRRQDGTPYATRDSAVDAIRSAKLDTAMYFPMKAEGGGWVIGTKMGRLESFMATEIRNPSSESTLKAMETSKELTFTRELRGEDELGGFFERGAKAIQAAKAKKRFGFWGGAKKFALNKIFTFVSTPFQIFQAGFRRTPLGILGILPKLTSALYGVKKGTPFVESYPVAAIIKDAADQIFGWGITLLMLAAAEGDDDDDDKQFLVTGSKRWGESPDAERALSLRREPATVIRIGGKDGVRIPYGRYEPVGTALATGVDLAGRIKRGFRDGLQPAKELAGLAGLIIRRVQDMPMAEQIATLSRLATAFSEDSAEITVKSDSSIAWKPWREMSRFTNNILGGYMPNLIKQAARRGDDYARDKDGLPWWHALIYDTMPLGELPRLEVPPRVDFWGNPVERQYGGGVFQRVWRMIGDSTYEPSPDRAKADAFWTTYMRRMGEPPEGSRLPNVTKVNRYIDPANPGSDNNGYVNMTPEQRHDFLVHVGARFYDLTEAILTDHDLENPTPRVWDMLDDAYTKTVNQVRREMFPSHAAWEKASVEARKAAQPPKPGK